MIQAQVWSCGGGTQSAAIAALVILGRLPKPDHALIVDTKRERTTTWDYLDTVLRPAMAAVGVDIVRVDRDAYTDTDLYGGADGESMLMPAYTMPAGRLATYCSGEWKREVAARYMRRTLGLEAAVDWIGYSTDEMGRIRTPRRQWHQLRFPLIDDVPLSRQGCQALVRSMGWPAAPRSSCVMCPHHSDEEWRDMKDNQPGDFAQAVAVEAQIRERDDGLYLSPRRIPLQQIDFRDAPSLFTGTECVGECFT